MYESFLDEVNSDYSIYVEKIPHSPNPFPTEQENDYNSEGILEKTPHH